MHGRASSLKERGVSCRGFGKWIPGPSSSGRTNSCSPRLHGRAAHSQPAHELPRTGRYLGNYYYNITNKLALKAAGGSAGFPLTIATLQLGVGCIYALFLWAAPDSRKFPTVTTKDIIDMIPVAFCAAAAHSFSVFALSAGAVSFGQIVKAAEPAFAAVLGVSLYGKKISKGKVSPSASPMTPPPPPGCDDMLLFSPVLSPKCSTPSCQIFIPD